MLVAQVWVHVLGVAACEMGDEHLKSPQFHLCVARGLLWTPACSGMKWGLTEARVTFCPCFSLGDSTDVFICTSPIKKYRYCPYEKVSSSESQLPTALPRCPVKGS